MSVAIVTGSAGLIGSEAARHFAGQGLLTIGIDNDMRRQFFGDEASTAWQRSQLQSELGPRYFHVDQDIRDMEAMDKLFARNGRDISLFVHAACAAVTRLAPETRTPTLP